MPAFTLWAPLLIINFAQGCSTLSNREKTLLQTASAGVVGGLVGSSLTPQGENQAAHAAMWAGISASVAGAFGLYVNSDERELHERSAQILALRKELSSMKGEDFNGEITPLADSKTSLESNLPSEYRKLIRPGGWTLYKKNEWVQVSETEMVHQDKRLILSPPSLNFGKISDQ